MHILFTEEEKNYIDKEPFNWKVKKDCPDDIKETLERKLKALNSEDKIPKLQK